MMSALFSEFRLAGMDFPNRIVVSPMCQHMADDGSPSDWHLIHWGGLALSGAALVMIESTGVEPEGRIGPRCLGLYSDEAAAVMGRTIDSCRRYGSSRFGVQLSHAGRKGSTLAESLGQTPLSANQGAWPTYAPSAISVTTDWPRPLEMDRADIKRVRDAFVSAAVRARDIDVDVLELHAAHGYLLHQFFSPVTNQRKDSYGGSPEARMRFPLEVFEAVRDVWPSDRPLGLRISGSDWLDDGVSIDDSVEFANELRKRGADFCDVSSGGINRSSRPPQVTSSYQVPLAKAVRDGARIPTFAVGMIVSPHQAEEIISSGSADFVCLGRAFLDDPHWPWHAAVALGANLDYPVGYQRSHPSVWSPSTMWEQHR